MIKIITFVFSIYCIAAPAQYENPDSISRIQLHMGIGYYMAGDDLAIYYSGADNNRFLQVTRDNPNSVTQIREALGGYPYDIAELPSNLIYRNQVSFMLSGTYAINQHWRILAMMQQVKLEAIGSFTLSVERTNTQNPNEDYIEQYSIVGKERRSHFQLGAIYRIPLNPSFYLNLGGGLDINTVEVLSNSIFVGSREFALPAATIYQPQAGQITTSGIGFFAFPELAYENVKGLGIFIRASYINTKISLNKVTEDNTSVWVPALGFSWSF